MTTPPCGYERPMDLERTRRELCPSCLEMAMGEGATRGIVGDEKKAAVQITADMEPERHSIG